MAEVIRKLGTRWSGGKQGHIKRRITEFGLDTSHFLGQAHGRGKAGKRKSASDILCLREGSNRRTPAHYLRRALCELGVSHKCSTCGLEPWWNKKGLTLQVDHINNRWWDDRKENLRFLCPNCHSQTEGFSVKNFMNGTVAQLAGGTSSRI